MKNKLSALALIMAMATTHLQAQDTSSTVQTSLYLSREEFMVADNPRYTVFGGTPRRETDVQLAPTLGFGIGYAALVVGLHINQADAWWRNDQGTFHVVEDIQYAQGLDKCGHFFSGYSMSSFCTDMLMECGVSYSASTWWGSGMGLVYMTYVEVEDGFAVDWGFSPTDAASNLLGVGFFAAQQFVPELQNFTPRWSYIPPAWAGDADINHRPKTFIDDYNGTTFWLATNVNNLLPASIEPYWPDWMMLSVGYGIRNYGVEDGHGGLVPVKPKFLVGIDYDWVKIFPESSIGLVNYLKQILNHVRLPGPTLEFSADGTRFGLVYPFAIVVPF